MVLNILKDGNITKTNGKQNENYGRYQKEPHPKGLSVSPVLPIYRSFLLLALIHYLLTFLTLALVSVNPYLAAIFFRCD